MGALGWGGVGRERGKEKKGKERGRNGINDRKGSREEGGEERGCEGRAIEQCELLFLVTVQLSSLKPRDYLDSFDIEHIDRPFSAAPATPLTATS